MAYLYFLLFMEQIRENIITVLIRLDIEAQLLKCELPEYVKRGNAITNILNKVSSDFGDEFMIAVYADACDRAGHTINPIDPTNLHKMINRGFKVTQVHNIVNKNTFKEMLL